MDTKSINNTYEVKGDGQGIQRISGYASVFNNIDSYGDIVLPGAFASAVANHAKRPIKLLSSHEMDAKELLGTIDVLKEDQRGLYFEASISQAPSAQDLAIKAKEGHLNEVSIGFFLKDHEYVKTATGENVRLIKSTELIEISLVSRAANPEAKVLQVKQEQTQSISTIESVSTNNNTGVVEMENKNEEIMNEMLKKLEALEKAANQPVNKIEEKAMVTPKVNKEEELEGLFFDLISGSISKSEYKREVERKALSSVIAQDGGLAVPTRLHDEIIQAQQRITKVEDFCRKLTGNGPLDILDYSFSPTWATHDDNGTISEASISSILGKNNLDPQDFAALVGLPKRLERRSFVNLQTLIANDYARAHRELKANKILAGSGHKEPLGIVTLLNNLATNTVTITALTNLDTGDLVNLEFKLEEQYRQNARFLVTKDALAKLRKLNDTANMPVWTRSLVAGQPATLMGYPLHEIGGSSLGVSSGDSCIVFGDMQKYFILEEKAFQVDVSNDYEFNKNKVSIRMVVSFDGMPVDWKAFAQVKLA